jgi:hypothetical protein
MLLSKPGIIVRKMEAERSPYITVLDIQINMYLPNYQHIITVPKFALHFPNTQATDSTAFVMYRQQQPWTDSSGHAQAAAVMYRPQLSNRHHL